MTGRRVINPASGLAVPDSIIDRIAAAAAFAGVELVTEQRSVG
jgi:hypothetical protein